MRSLATDIRNGMQFTKYKIQDSSSNDAGGHCALGVAALGSGVGLHMDCGKTYPEQYKNTIIYGVVGLNDNTDLSIPEMADRVEQWEHISS